MSTRWRCGCWSPYARSLNPWLALFALVGVIVVFVQAWEVPAVVGDCRLDVTNCQFAAGLCDACLHGASGRATIFDTVSLVGDSDGSDSVAIGCLGCFIATGTKSPSKARSCHSPWFALESRGDQRPCQNTERLCGPSRDVKAERPAPVASCRFAIHIWQQAPLPARRQCANTGPQVGLKHQRVVQMPARSLPKVMPHPMRARGERRSCQICAGSISKWHAVCGTMG